MAGAAGRILESFDKTVIPSFGQLPVIGLRGLSIVDDRTSGCWFLL